jgi:outer membrane lipoprotein
MGRSAISFVAYLLLFFVLGVVTACTPAISKQLRQEAGKPVPFEALQKRTDDYKGRVVIIGGYILETANEPEGSWLTVLQSPLNSLNRPESSDLSKGRFLVWSQEFLDPVVYSKERRITVGGKVRGSEERKLGSLTYRYPVIEAKEIHLWPEEGKYVGPYYPYYDPWIYPWYPYPWYPYPYPYRYPYR